MDRYRFALRPKWVLSHLLVLTLVAVMIGLGFWQLRRLDEKRTYNDSIRANQSLPVASLDTVVRPNDPASRGQDLTFRRVTVIGTYDRANEVIIRARSLNGRPGVWVATPLRMSSGDAVVVIRGFLPTQGTPDSVPPEAEPPIAEVTVEGLIQEAQTKGLFGATDPTEGRLANLARVDVARIQQQVGYPLYPVYLQLTSSQPGQAGAVPEVLPEPVLDDGPHLGYAVQWFIFSLIAIGGYPLILRRSVRNRDAIGDDAGAHDPPVLASATSHMRGR